MGTIAPDYMKEAQEAVKAGTKKRSGTAFKVILIVFAGFVLAMIAAVLLIRAVFFPYYGKKDEAIRLMRKEYKVHITFSRFVQHGDYDFLWWAGSKDFYAKAPGLEDASICVTRSEDERTVFDNYLSYAYEEDIDAYFSDLFDDYFPGGDIEVVLDHRAWMHETENIDFDDYIDDMEGHNINIKVCYTDGCPDRDEFNSAVYEISEDGLDWAIRISIWIDGEELMYGQCLPGKEQSDVATYPAYDEVFN